jgi:Ca2+-binding EF-hand superfamily protein
MIGATRLGKITSRCEIAPSIADFSRSAAGSAKGLVRQCTPRTATRAYHVWNWFNLRWRATRLFVCPKEEIIMRLIKLSALALAFAATVSIAPAFAQSALTAVDTDHDGTIDLNEAKTAAVAEFDKLDVDHDGTLDYKELHGRISKADWQIADPDHDKTISKDEYIAFVEFAFNRADKDHEGTIDKKEARTPEGKALMRLLK